MQNAVQPLIKDGCDVMSIIYYNIIDTSLVISHLFIFHSREREAMKDEGTHYGAMDKSYLEKTDLCWCIAILHCEIKQALSSHR